MNILCIFFLIIRCGRLEVLIAVLTICVFRNVTKVRRNVAPSSSGTSTNSFTLKALRSHQTSATIYQWLQRNIYQENFSLQLSRFGSTVVLRGSAFVHTCPKVTTTTYNASPGVVKTEARKQKDPIFANITLLAQQSPNLVIQHMADRIAASVVV